MTRSTITTAAFLAGVTTLAVSLPTMAAEKRLGLKGFDLSVEQSVGDLDIYGNQGTLEEFKISSEDLD